MELKNFSTSAYLTAMSGKLIKKDTEDKKEVMKEAMDIITYMSLNIPISYLNECDVNKIARGLLESRFEPDIACFVKTSLQSSNDIALECSKMLGDTYGVKQLNKKLVKKVIQKQKVTK